MILKAEKEKDIIVGIFFKNYEQDIKQSLEYKKRMR